MSGQRTPGFLMCPPEHYRVEYVINPWMEEGRRKPVDTQAPVQWHSLRAILERDLGVCVQEIQQQPGLPDMVFTANAGLIMGDTFVPSRFRHAERAGEEAYFTAWARRAGYGVQTLPGGLWFEGAGDALFDRRRPILWMGHGFRTDPEAATALNDLTRAIGIRTVPLRLDDPRYYHLDTCFCPLPGGYTMYYPAAFSPESLDVLEALIPEEQRIAVSSEDAIRFACNSVCVGDAIVLNAASEGLRRQLGERGFRVFITPLDRFIAAGGSAKCLTLRLDEPADTSPSLP